MNGGLIGTYSPDKAVFHVRTPFTKINLSLRSHAPSFVWYYTLILLYPKTENGAYRWTLSS